MMKSVLEQLNGVPEVIGSMVCDSTFEPRASLFPPLFDGGIIRTTAEILASAPFMKGESTIDGGIDIRYADGRIILRTLSRGFILVLCTRGVNFSLLNISLNVACKRLDELLAEGASPVPDQTPRQASPPKTDGDTVILTVDELDSSTEAGKGFQELGMVAVTAATAKRLLSFFSLPALKRVRLTHVSSGASGVFGMMLFPDDSGRYDGSIIISRHVEKKLAAARGDRLKVDPA